MSAGTVAADEAQRLLEATADPVRRAEAIVRRRPGVATRQRGRTGKTQNADDFNKKHSRGQGGKFRKESESEHESEQETQKKLKAAGLYKGEVDGKWGPQSQAALKTFQQRNGIAPTGNMDERTKLALDNPAPRSREDVEREERKLLADKSKGGGSAGKRASKAASAHLDASSPASVKAFQREHGLAADGVIGPETQRAMRKDGADKGADKGSSGSRTGRSSRSGGSRDGGELPGGTLRQGVGMDRKRGNGDVKAVQNMLQELGYDLGDAGVDGKYGPKTAEAIRKFQQEHGLAADGVFGRHTRRLLNLSNSRTHTRRGKDNAPLAADEESLSTKRRRRGGTSVAEAALLLLEAPDARAATADERAELWARFPEFGPAKLGEPGAFSLKRDKGGLFIHTHRARSKSFETVKAIPETVARFIESTG